jgi:Spy/CpxP family protein refolding chaperone
MNDSTHKTLSHHARRVATTTAAVLALAFGTVASTAAFGGPAAPGGRGPGAPGGEPFGPQVIESIKARLNLDSSQLQHFDQALAESKAAREGARADRLKFRETLRAELAKPEPDLAAVARIADAEQARNQAVRNQVRDRWLRLYATFSPEQKAVVREALVARMNRGDAVREQMRERLGG